jgi:hypothetical protein
LKQILHNWSDEECVAILKTVRKAIAVDGRIVIIDRLLPQKLGPDRAFAFDVLMMIWSTGQERTQSQVQALLTGAGFALVAVIRNEGRLSVIEAIPA